MEHMQDSTVTIYYLNQEIQRYSERKSSYTGFTDYNNNYYYRNYYHLPGNKLVSFASDLNMQL